eukprot:tig00021468_g21648.t1
MQNRATKSKALVCNHGARPRTHDPRLSPNPGGRTAFSEPSVSDCGVAWGGPLGAPRSLSEVAPQFQTAEGSGRTFLFQTAERPGRPSRCARSLSEVAPQFQTAERPGAAPLGAPRSLSEVAPQFQTAERPGAALSVRPALSLSFRLRSGLGSPLGAASPTQPRSFRLRRAGANLLGAPLSPLSAQAQPRRTQPPQFQTAEGPGRTFLFETAERPGRTFLFQTAERPGRPPCFRLRSGLGSPSRFRLRSGLGQPSRRSLADAAPQFQTAERPGATHSACAPPLFSAGAAAPDAASTVFELRAARGELLVSNCGAARGEPLVFELRGGPGRPACFRLRSGLGRPSSSSGRQTAQRPKGFWS